MAPGEELYDENAMLKTMVENLKDALSKMAEEKARLKEEMSEKDSAMADYRRRLAYYDNPPRDGDERLNTHR